MNNCTLHKDDPLVMYLIVKESLNMSIGKTAAQIGHIVQYLCEGFFKDELSSESKELFSLWNAALHRKIILRANDNDWEKVLSLPKETYRVVVDAGLTELKPNEETAIGLFPIRKSATPKIIKRLRLL